MSPRPEEIVIRNWGKFQHYKKRNPPWIRLYRDLIDSSEWRSLSDPAARLLVELWILASELDPGGRVPFDVTLLAWRTGRASTDASIVASLHELVRQGFVSVPKLASPFASTNASANASTSTPQRQSTETEHTPFAREDEGPTEFASWLGGYAMILEDCPPAEDPVTQNTLFMHYGPPGMRAKAWALPDGSSVPEAERPRIFALALSGYAGEGRNEIVTSEFAGMLKRVIADEMGTDNVRRRSSEAERSGFMSTDADFEPGGIYGPPADA